MNPAAASAAAAERRMRGAEDPIRGELFSTERLEQFAEGLATQHSVFPGKRRGKPFEQIAIRCT